MAKKLYPHEKVMAVLADHARGVSKAELLTRHGISRGTLHRWQRKYADASAEGVALMRQAGQDEIQRWKWSGPAGAHSGIREEGSASRKAIQAGGDEVISG